MKKLFYLLSASVGLFLNNSVKAAPGDTTWVQAHTDVQMDHFGNFDSSIAFPNGSVQYRKIYMIFELGKYACPGNPQYCYDWDYTVQTFMMPPSGDTLEMGRLITPYADHTLGARMPMNWKGKYVFDVTDYYPVLKNNAIMRVLFSGYSNGFTTTVKFAFIEGTPTRNVLEVKKIWGGNYNYGHGSVPINTALADVALTAPAGTVSAESKLNITGHGGDATANAAEFYPNSYTMNLNSTPLATQNFWRNDCGFNNYYPQNGTWVFDRASWCPGDLVHNYSHVLTGVTANSNYTLNVTFPPYSSTPSGSGSQAVYTIENNVIYYGAFNKTLDASLEDIIAPTVEERHFRKNPFVGKPEVIVSNTGGTAITSIKFEYGLDGTPLQQYTWNGSINSLDKATIALDESASLKAATGTNNKFIVNILQVNGQADNDATNDMQTSMFNAAPKWDATIRVELRTNASVVAGGISEDSWKIYDVDGNVVAQRINNAPNTTYIDTVRLGTSSYKLEVIDEGCDGINWWLFPNYPVPPGSGYVKAFKSTGIIPLQMRGYFNGDFGCGFTQYFTTDPLTGVEEIGDNAKPEINVFPNPANDNVSVSIEGLTQVDGTIRITDAIGKIVYSKTTRTRTNTINTSALSGGLYFVTYKSLNSSYESQTKLVISK